MDSPVMVTGGFLAGVPTAVRLASVLRSTSVASGLGVRASGEPAASFLVATERSSVRERQGGRVRIPATDSPVMVTGGFLAGVPTAVRLASVLRSNSVASGLGVRVSV